MTLQRSIFLKANEYLEIAQDMFGPKIPEWEFCGIEIENAGPHLKYYPETRQVAIVLSDKIINDEVQLTFQLSHEVCHLLHPSMNSKTLEPYKTTNFNEGLSTFFQIEITSRLIEKPLLIGNIEKHSTNYYHAYRLVEQLLSIDRKIVTMLRSLEPRIDNINHTHFNEIEHKVEDALIQKLIEPFKS